MTVPFAFPQPYDSIKRGVIVGRLTQRRLREPRKITLLTKWKELITLSAFLSASLVACSTNAHLGLSYFPQEIETVISGKTSLEQSSWEWYMPGYPHLPRVPTWPTWQWDNGEWCQRLWRLWLSCSPGLLSHLLPAQSLLLFRWWRVWWGKIDGPGQIRHRAILCPPWKL